MPAAPEFSSASDHVHRSGAPASIPASVHSLRSETAWFPRSRPPLAIRRPSATIRQDRFRSQTRGCDTGGLTALPPSPTPPSAHGLSPALHSRNCAAHVLARQLGFAQEPPGFWGSLSLPRSRIRSLRALFCCGLPHTALRISPAPPRPTRLGPAPFSPAENTPSRCGAFPRGRLRPLNVPFLRFK